MGYGANITYIEKDFSSRLNLFFSIGSIKRLTTATSNSGSCSLVLTQSFSVVTIKSASLFRANISIFLMSFLE